VCALETPEAVLKHPWQLALPNKILNKCPFFYFAKQNQKMGIYLLFYEAVSQATVICFIGAA
jgi:hypothetical protein